jgi:flagellin
MRIHTNVSALQAHQNLSRTNAAAQDSMAKLSSGFRITKAGDDAAGLSIANNLRTTVRSLTMASRNIEQAQSVLSVAEGAAGSIEKILERMKELSVQASTDTNESQRVTLQKEFADLRTEIGRIVDSTKFQDKALINGTFTGQNIQVGATADPNDSIAVSLGNLGTGAGALNISGLDLTVDASAAMTSIDTAIKTVNGVLGDLGAYQNRLDYAQQNVKTAVVNVSAAESVIRDVDMAEEMSKFSKSQILAQAGTAMLAQANQSSQNVLQLLRG